MGYEIRCDCGRAISVAEGDAGSRISCACGLTVQVPSLNQLRASAGEERLAPDFVVEQLLYAGRLPSGEHCVWCGVVTDGRIHCQTECERETVREQASPGWFAGLGVLTGLPFLWNRKETRRGRDLILTLPLRVCPSCQPALTGADTAKEAMRRDPLYRRLLEKFPKAKVSVGAAQSDVSQ